MDLFLLICHRSERSEVKRSRESIVRCALHRSVDCHALMPYGGARYDGALGARRSLDSGCRSRAP
ncbi:MAG: hypothetical protein NC218_07970 [Acetobacter sp.]|nr:hypothetical protein [Acetobacter sp.]